MIALRQEALRIVNDTPEEFLSALVQTLKDFKFKKFDFTEKIDDEEFFSRRAEAIAAIKDWQKRNENILKSDIDWDKEIESAMEEKYEA